MNQERMLQLFVGIVLLGLDLGSKQFFSQRDGVVWNTGVAFGLFADFWWMGVLIVIWLLLVWEWWRASDVLLSWGLWLLVIGGLGNLIDRVWVGAVRDFIYYPVLEVYGNVADILLVVGVGWLLLVELRKQVKHGI